MSPKLFIEVDAGKEQPEEGKYWTTIYHSWYGAEIKSATTFKDGKWHIGKAATVESFLRPIQQQEGLAIEFAEWCAENYTRVKDKWVSLDIGVLVHGSEIYYNELVKEHGKTTDEIYSIFNLKK